MTSNNDIAQQLCTVCGLCCDGTLFRDVELTAEDAKRVQAVGMVVKKSASKIGMAQPCAALNCFLCKVYTERPRYCREFECALLKSTVAGTIQTKSALRTIKSAQKKAALVKELLRALGNHDEQLALSKRFKKVAKNFEEGAISSDQIGTYGDLTIAVHELNFLLSTAFYPGS